jgi:hypothetical protein
MVSLLNMDELKYGSVVRGSLAPNCRLPFSAQFGLSTAEPAPALPVPSQ